MRLSVFDPSPITAGSDPGAAIAETVALARFCDELGYHRYWVAEHHDHASFASAAPEVLLGALAVATTRIRIGAGAVILPHYAPYKVAGQFRLLAALAPGRVDLGLGRGPGAERAAAYALRPELLDNPLAAAGPDPFPGKVADLLDFLDGTPAPPESPYSGVTASPAGPPAPTPWILGSTLFGARFAAHLGLPYCYAHFFDDGRGAAEALAAYRDGFNPSPHAAAPQAAIAVMALAAETAAEAERLFLPYALWRRARDRRRNLPFPGPAEVAAAAGLAGDPATAALRAATIHGPAGDVLARLEREAAAVGADEVLVATLAHDPEDRHRSYALLAATAGL